MHGDKPVNVSSSNTPLKGERLTDKRPKPQWTNIDWDEVEKHVNRLQTRITKAVKQRKWHLVKRLQYLLTQSFYAKLLVVKRVTQNKGKRTAGIDGAKWTTPNSRMNAALKLAGGKYKATPLRRVYIPKPGTNKKRPLSIPTMYDRAMQMLHALALQPIAETTADPRSYGFRKNRSTQDACQYAFVCLSSKYSAQWVLEGDIKGCFDNINHDWLLDNIPMDKSILTQFLKGLTVEPLGQGHIFRTQMRVKGDNKTVLTTYPEKDGEVLLKSRMREIFTSGSVRGLIVTWGYYPKTRGAL